MSSKGLVAMGIKGGTGKGAILTAPTMTTMITMVQWPSVIIKPETPKLNPGNWDMVTHIPALHKLIRWDSQPQPILPLNLGQC